MNAGPAVVCSECGRSCGRYVIGRNTDRPRCKTCYVRDPNNEETIAHKQAVAAAVGMLEPKLSERAILSCIDKTTTSLYRLRVLARAVAEVPDALMGSTKVPPIVYHLISHLLESEANNISLPRCSNCDKQAPLTNTSGDDRICKNCYVRLFQQGDCSGCGRRRIILGHTERGEPLCGTCYARDPSKWSRCDLCGEVNRIITRDETGAATCQRCYQRPLHLCDGCGERAEIASRRDGKAMCKRCYHRPPRRCGSCGRMRAIRCRASGADPDLCDACGWARVALCSRCGHEGRCTGIREGRPVCLRCSLGDAVTQLLTGSDGHIPESLMPVRDMILAVDNARSGEQWICRSPAATVLKEIVNGTMTLTHEALDALPASTSLVHLRDLLIACGALPERDPYLARLERFIDDQAASLEGEDARHLKTFGMWTVLRRARHRVANGRPAITATRIGKITVREAALFIKWLHQRGRSVSDCNQADIDQWLADGVKTRFRIRPFVTWAVKRRAMQKVSVPTLSKDAAAVPVDLDGRVALARRLLGDDALDPADRFAGALVVIYAQPVTRIVRLKTSDVIESEGNTFIRLGTDAVLMPEPLGALVRELPWRRQVGISGQAKPSEWLFPGRQAGRHQHPQHVQRRLARIGIECRASRDAALTQLAAEVPASVLADMLGVHVTTATKWADRVSGNWVNYVASKVRDQSLTPKEESVI